MGEGEGRADVAGDHHVLLHRQRPFVSSRRGATPSWVRLLCACAACLARSSAISSFFDSLPMRVFGRTSRNSTWRGISIGEIRSEEHTSELQSLMRISYAVFCLKKNIQTL